MLWVLQLLVTTDINTYIPTFFGEYLHIKYRKHSNSEFADYTNIKSEPGIKSKTSESTTVVYAITAPSAETIKYKSLYPIT